MGIVVTGMTHSPEGRRRLAASGIPVVETWDLSPTPIDMAVGFSHERIGEEVCEYLHGRGRRRVAIVSADDERARRRVGGFRHVARKVGLAGRGGEVPVHWMPAPATLARARAGFAALVESMPDVDAVFCSSDLVALGVITEAHARGLQVPRDVAIVGFGDLDFAAGVLPSLTTVRVDGERIGRIAAGFIVDRAEGRAVESPIVDVGFSLVRRASA